MLISSRTVGLLAAIAALALAAPAASAAPRAAAVTPDTPASWTGATASGLNVSWFTDSLRPSGKCGTTQTDYCDDTLVHLTAEQVAAGDQLKIRIEGFDPAPSDFDLRVYASDETGGALEYLDSPTGDASGNLAAGTPLETTPVGFLFTDPRNTSVGDFETKLVDLANYTDELGAADAYFLVRVVYFAVPDGSYEGSASVVTPAAG